MNQIYISNQIQQEKTMDNHENKPVQGLIDAYRDRWCYDSSYKLIERLLEEVTKEQIEKMIQEVNNKQTQDQEEYEEEQHLKAEAKQAALEDEWWNAIK